MDNCSKSQLHRYLRMTATASLVAGLLAIPKAVFANAGLPMLAVVWPLSAIMIVPVIFVESWVIQRALNVGWRKAIVQMAKANIFSTLIGIPLAWVASVAFEFLLAFLVINVSGSKSYPPHIVGEVGSVILTAPWLGPTGDRWTVPLAMTVLLIPFFFVSYWAEAWYASHMLSPSAPDRARRAIWNANLASYSALFCVCINWLVFGILNH